MKEIKYPSRANWPKLLKRPEFERNQFTKVVSDILAEVKQNGDSALIKFTEKFDGVKLDSLLVSQKEIEIAISQVSEELANAIKLAKANIEKFHEAQNISELRIETTKGVSCWRRSVGIEKVGLYIPGGSAPLFSTILMLAIPAQIAGCDEIVLCTPPNSEGNIDSAILFTANLVGVSKIYKVGGAQAIAAMAFGTASIPQVYKIFGPGNQFVTKAKELIQQEGVAIDMPAGPSEVLIIADTTCNPSFVAADLLSQSEHGADSQVILVSDDESVISQVNIQLEIQLAQLPRVEVATKSLENSRSILLKDMKECVDFSNEYAPEHLIIASEIADTFIEKIVNAGSVFLGNYSCESAGDYASGTNHTLPTNGYARNYSGVSLDSFVKKITFQKLEKEGIKNIGPAVEIMAAAEQLFAHKNAVTLRLKEIQDV
jgi:histidinol dehydrogenase|tara:strand:+ start:2362 stop:3651 length:1290 start_codon:yes stop_codon:yes gene_type:complete